MDLLPPLQDNLTVTYEERQMDTHASEIQYREEPDLTVEEFVDILRRSTLADRRPVEHPERIGEMLRHATLIVTARRNECLVGVCRTLSDRAYVTYVSDLAVDVSFQRQGIGRRLLELTHELAGRETRLVLLAAPAAREYYPHIGMERHDSCWTLPPLSAH